MKTPEQIATEVQQNAQPSPAILPYTSNRCDGWGVRPLDKNDPDL